MLLLLILLLLLFGGFGFYGGSRYGAYSWSPVGIVVLIIILLALFGRL